MMQYVVHVGVMERPCHNMDASKSHMLLNYIQKYIGKHSLWIELYILKYEWP